MRKRACGVGSGPGECLQWSAQIAREPSATVGGGTTKLGPLLHNTTLVPVANCFLSRFYNRDTVAGINVSKPFVPIAIDPGQM